MKNLSFSKVKINNGFWEEKQSLIRKETLWAVYERFCETHRFEALSCTWKEGDPDEPHVFWDSDVAKWIEAAAYLLTFERDEKIESIVDEAVANIQKNQDEYGYYNAHYLVTEKDKRFTNRYQHELYCLGHLIEAAVAYSDTTGKNAFLDVVCKYTDYVEKIFKIEDSAPFTTPGHPEIELALVKLYRKTREKRYLELSKYFIDKRGTVEKEIDHKTNSTNDAQVYMQDNVLLKDRSHVEGHAVRMMYLLCGVVDAAIECNDADLIAACRRCFDNAVNRRMYITGGLGSAYHGEAFTQDYHLPNRTAYAETCAAISLAFFAHRMQQIDNDSRYADIVEKVIYNGSISGLSLDGKAFLYINPLEIDLDTNNAEKSTGGYEWGMPTQRSEIFSCSCCPPNILRLIASVGDFACGYDDDNVFINQYFASNIEFEGTNLEISTQYPVCGNVSVKYKTDKHNIAFRVPAWCKNFKVNKDYYISNGYAYIKAEGEGNFDIVFDMPVQIVMSDPRVHENAGKVAVMRGPLVYCAEGIDNDVDLKNVYIPIDAQFETYEGEFPIPSLKTTAYRLAETDALYRTADSYFTETELKLNPYYTFANRGESQMLVWFMRK